MIKIYTSYFANMKNIDKDVFTISICGKCPEWYLGEEYKVLAPKYWFFSEYKKTKDEVYYTNMYDAFVLDKLSIHNIIEHLENAGNHKDVVLLCYEKPGDFCHRHLVSNWFNKNGILCEEWRNDCGK